MTNLTINQKLELLRKLERGVSVASVCEEYGVKKQTVSDIRKAKDKLRGYPHLLYTILHCEYITHTIINNIALGVII